MGTRYGIWIARANPWRAVLLEELPGPWNAPLSRIGRTFRVGTFLLNTRSRITIPTLT